MNKNSNTSRNAFTLAEVLITITVIGVVAALTIPSLVNNYQNKAWSTASTIFQRKLGEALKVMNSQGTLAGYSSTEDFVNELSKHIKINKICKKDKLTDCFADKVYWSNSNEIEMTNVKKAKHMGHENWSSETIGIQFADGTTGIIAYNPECTQDPYRTDVITVSKTGIGTDCLAILYDTTGFKEPNTFGKDMRGLNVDTLNGNCAIELSDGTCLTAPFIPKPLTREECAALPAELGVTSCMATRDDDYWAGAVKECYDRGTSLATSTELVKLRGDLYPNGQQNPRNNELAMSLGFVSSPEASFWLWNNSLYSEGLSNYYIYRADSAGPYCQYRWSGNVQAVCIGE